MCQLPYRFYQPELHPFVLGLAHLFIPYNLRHHQRIEGVDIAGVEHLAPLLDRGDNVLLTPSHPDQSDCFVMFELGRSSSAIRETTYVRGRRWDGRPRP